MRSSLIAALHITTTAVAEPAAGRATVIDGDTPDIGGRCFRLHGIDPPESGPSCLDVRQAG